MDSVNVPRRKKVWMFVKQPMNIIDILAVAPFYIELLLADDGSGLVALRVLRLCRLLRVLKLNKYNAAFGIFFSTLVRSMPALSVLLFIMALCVT